MAGGQFEKQGFQTACGERMVVIMVEPNDLLSKRFEKKRGGYNIAEVDSYMVEVASVISKMKRDTAEQKRKYDAAMEKIDEFEKERKSLSEALLNAQKLSDSILRDARARAEKIEKEATGKANSLIGEIHDEIVAEQQKLVQMKREVSDFRSQLMSLYRAHIELINDIPSYHEEAPATPAESEQAEQEIVTQVEEPAPEAKPVESKAEAPEAGKGDEPTDGSHIAFEQVAAAKAEEPDSMLPAIEPVDLGAEEAPDTGVPDLKLNVRFDAESGEYVPISSAQNKHYDFDSFMDRKK